MWCVPAVSDHQGGQVEVSPVLRSKLELLNNCKGDTISREAHHDDLFFGSGVVVLCGKRDGQRVYRSRGDRGISVKVKR